MSFGVVLVIIVAACGGGNGTGCGLDIQTIRFQNMEACEAAKTQLFPDAGKDGINPEPWNPRREMQCVDGAMQ